MAEAQSADDPKLKKTLGDFGGRRGDRTPGLGIANGERPFKVFHKPMHFLPRSTIRVQVEEVFGRGRLFLVFQGYKILR